MEERKKMKKILVIAGFILLIVGQNGLCEEKPFEADMYTMALWHFDEGEGSIVKDASGFGAEGKFITNREKGGLLPEWVEGKFGKGLRFHGNWDVVEVKNIESLKIEGPITIEAWVKFDDPTETAEKIIAGNKSSSPQGGFKLGYTIWREYKGFYFEIGDGEKNHTAHSLPMRERLSPDTWYYVAAVYDGENLKIYLDGKDVTDGQVTSPAHARYIWPVFLGGYHFSFNRSFKGVIDEVRISNVGRKIVSLKD